MDKDTDVFFDHFRVSPGPGASRLHEVAAAFSRIPWENLTKFLLKTRGRERLRMPGEVLRGFAEAGTGGTCYSLTEALRSILTSCGWRVRPLTGHMRHGKNIHCALLAEGEDGVFLLDPGYVVPVPVRLDREGGRVVLPGRELIWTPRERGWNLYTREGDGPLQWRYSLESREVSREQFLGYWKRSFSAPGLNSLHINLSLEDGRLSAHNGNLRVTVSGSKENRKLSRDYPETVAEVFGLNRSVAEEAWKELARLRRERRDSAGS